MIIRIYMTFRAKPLEPPNAPLFAPSQLLRNIRSAVLSTFSLTGLATLANVAGLPLGGLSDLDATLPV
jgi:hypothetical protein